MEQNDIIAISFFSSRNHYHGHIVERIALYIDQVIICCWLNLHGVIQSISVTQFNAVEVNVLPSPFVEK